MRCGRLLEASLDSDVVWVKLGASMGGGDDVVLGSRASLLAKGGDLALSDEASGLTRSRSSLNSLAADLVLIATDWTHKSKIAVWNREKACEG